MKKEYPEITKRRLLASLLFGFLLVYLVARSMRAPANYKFTGFTMGTTYSVNIARARLDEDEGYALKRGMESLLAEINKSMSTWDKSSEISLFNNSTSTQPYAVSREFADVVSSALEICALTEGAFDPTVSRLVDLWGFGSEGDHGTPSREDIDTALKTVGYTNLCVVSERSIQKKIPALALNLSGVAKGYAVDRVADYLSGRGFTNILVEIGGEIALSGGRMPGRKWRVSIEVPEMSRTERGGNFRIMTMTGKGVATSGDYHNFRKTGEVAISHLLDPRTGRPVSNGICSVTVIAESCMKADALATGLMVMGVEEGMSLVEKIDGTEALFISRSNDGSFVSHMTPGFKAFLLPE